jgi:hemolysin activation/secretion protein
LPGGTELENRRQLERLERQQQRPTQQGPAVVGPSRPGDTILKPGGPKFLLRRLEFDDSKFLSRQELDPLAAPLTGRQVDFSDLQKLIAAINALYATKNIPTGIATLPPQDVKDGVVKIKLTEGRLEKMSVTGVVQTWPGYILHKVEQPAGEVLDVPQLGRDVTWFNRTNDVQIRALLQPGTSFGLTDVQLAATEAPANTLQFFTDNQGVKSTGRYQGGVYYKSSGALGFDDRFTFYGTTAQGNLNGNVSYNVPFNPWGGRLGASYSQGQIRIVDGPSRELDVTGASQLGSLNLSQPVVVTDNWLLLANAARSMGVTKSWIGEPQVVDDHTQKSTAGFAVTQSSGLDYAISLSPAFNYVESHSEISGLNRYFNVYSASASLLIRLPANFSFSALGGGQYTQERLLPGDQLFQIGGPTTIRGFPTNAVAGDSGYYVNYELHNNLTGIVKGLDAYAFVDMGEVFSTFPPRTALYSAGAGLSWTPHAALTLEGSIGVPWNQVVSEQPAYQIYFRGTFRPLLLVL